MSARNTFLRYGNIAMMFHWIIAALIIVNLCLGLYMSDLPRSDPGRYTLFQFHKSVGLTVLVLSLLRLGWRLMNPVPPLPASMGLLLRLASRANHYLLYLLMVGIPFVGWMMVSASPLGLPTPYFGLFSWPHIPWLAELPRATKVPLHDSLEDLHAFLAFSAILLLVIHVGGALYHQFLRRDDVLKRMIPGTKIKEPI